MSAQDIIMSSRALHIRELKTQVDKLRLENTRLHDELSALKAHFDQALLAAMDLKGGEPLEIWDGWNLILGAQKIARSREDLIAQAKAAKRRIWIVLDGPKENACEEGKVRISYTGGTGEHRADRFITDFVRMAKYLNLADKISVRTNDKDFLRAVEAIIRT